MPGIEDLKRIAKVEFAGIVKSIQTMGFKIRIILTDNSFIDVTVSRTIPDKFGFHWECMDQDGSIYRYDNFHDQKLKSIETFPYHFHKGTKECVERSPFPLNTFDGFRGFMEFVKKKLKSKKANSG
ncbi:MAG: DUF6516 family protein [Candidatus Aminicenantes bacterium]|jgi:hypothetical protein